MDNPLLVYVKGNVFYFCESHPEDGDYVAASYAACHADFFGHKNLTPMRKGASYSPHFAVKGLWQLVV